MVRRGCVGENSAPIGRWFKKAVKKFFRRSRKVCAVPRDVARFTGKELTTKDQPALAMIPVRPVEPVDSGSMVAPLKPLSQRHFKAHKPCFGTSTLNVSLQSGTVVTFATWRMRSDESSTFG
jgi:hypothetical protein